MSNLTEEYQNLLEQLTFDPDPLAFEFRFRCNDPDTGFRILFTKEDEMSLFDIPIEAFDRPTVFNLNDFWPDKTLIDFVEVLVSTSCEGDQELHASQNPEEFIPMLYKHVQEGHQFLENLEQGGDSQESGSKLFSILSALITLKIRTELADDKSSGIFILPRSSGHSH